MGDDIICSSSNFTEATALEIHLGFLSSDSVSNKYSVNPNGLPVCYRFIIGQHSVFGSAENNFA